jgi:hypothetical protein
MERKWQLSLLPISVALVCAADQPWKDKQVAEWNADDAEAGPDRLSLGQTVKPTMDRSAQSSQRRSGGGMGRGGGIGMGGVGIGLPGMGGGRRGGEWSGPGGGGYGWRRRGGMDDGTGTDYNEPPPLKVRWESAFPIREAELKARHERTDVRCGPLCHRRLWRSQPDGWRRQ